MRSILFSVVIPIYNAKKYLNKCIESIISQSYSDFEIILVDDGSIDDSLSACEVYAKKDERIRVIHQENGGILKARCAGVHAAKGEYITFVDADDWIDSGAYSYVAKIIVDNAKIDIVDYGYRYNENGKEVLSNYKSGLYVRDEIEKTVIDGMMFDYQQGKRRLIPAVWSKFFRKALYMKIAAKVEGKITLGEDAIITYPAVCEANTMYISDKCFYHYRMNNEESCTHTFPLERITELVTLKNNMKNILKEQGYWDRLCYQFESYLRDFMELCCENWLNIPLQGVSYLFPAHLIPYGSKVVIYGAGAVGRSYMKCCANLQNVEVVAWLDNNYERKLPFVNQNIMSPDILNDLKLYDYIVIAVEAEDTAQTIIKGLHEKYGIEDEKVVWNHPKYLR